MPETADSEKVEPTPEAKHPWHRSGNVALSLGGGSLAAWLLAFIGLPVTFPFVPFALAGVILGWRSRNTASSQHAKWAMAFGAASLVLTTVYFAAEINAASSGAKPATAQFVLVSAAPEGACGAYCRVGGYFRNTGTVSGTSTVTFIVNGSIDPAKYPFTEKARCTATIPVTTPGGTSYSACNAFGQFLSAYRLSDVTVLIG
jgi:hypothetical protein